jgi:aryl-alcohol dehydrogenase-like predicted oxidoreductase
VNLGLGTASFGTSISPEKSFEIMDAFVGRGGRVIDTANNYAFWNGAGGESETVIGQWLQNAERSKIEIHTKIGYQPIEDGNTITYEGLGKKSIERAFEKSLSRLRTDYVDVLYAHVDDTSTSLEETWATLTSIVNEGYAVKLGISNYHPPRIEELRDVITRNGFTPISYAQYRYTIIDPREDADFGIQVCLTQAVKRALSIIGDDVTLVAYSPLLDGAFEPEKQLPDKYHTEENDLAVERLRSEASSLSVSPSALVLRRIADQGILPLTMTGKLSHLESNMSLFWSRNSGG